ncbi:MAG: protein-glutamine gamma-glutamyltransferase [Caproiciproducens sp.]|jgi:protein-glutamine gamma-glutamyltransferase|nr:protein-glutamine gamma-glutamyltransferase [Caproiciproducens sp.]
MIIIAGQPANIADISAEFPANSLEREIINTLASSEQKYQYDSVNQLKFELTLRREIINAANALYASDLSFKVFRKTTCNPAYWNRKSDGGFELKEGVKPSDAINDIFINSSLYGTECATAMVIVYYKALLSIFPEELFNQQFQTIYLMNWHNIDPLLREIGMMKQEKDYLPGDRRYFANPDVDPLTPEWQGENVIDMNHGLYYGHGLGKHNAETIISALNGNRREDADDSAYLVDSAGRPNFKNLSDIYYKAIS